MSVTEIYTLYNIRGKGWNRYFGAACFSIYTTQMQGCLFPSYQDKIFKLKTNTHIIVHPRPCIIHVRKETRFQIGESGDSDDRGQIIKVLLYVQIQPYCPVTLQSVLPVVRGFTWQWNPLQGHLIPSEVFCIIDTIIGITRSYKNCVKGPYPSTTV